MGWVREKACEFTEKLNVVSFVDLSCSLAFFLNLSDFIFVADTMAVQAFTMKGEDFERRASEWWRGKIVGVRVPVNLELRLRKRAARKAG